MIPYFAIIKDSFRAALQSYTLWGLFVAMTMLLLLIVPFGYTEIVTGHVRFRDVWDWKELTDRVYEGQQKDSPNPGKRIWMLLSPALQKSTEELYADLEETEQQLENGDSVELSTLRDQETRLGVVLNALHSELDDVVLADEDFYDPKAWPDLKPNEELQGLLDAEPAEMTELQIRRRNRLLLEAGFSPLVQRSAELAISPTYFGSPIGRAEGNTKDAVIEFYRGWIGWLINWPVGMLIVFVAIIATSSIMPRMFEPGSITLLLSKPISRWKLFLTQFAGACTFMLLISVYFTVGVWLIAVIRLGIGNPNVFWCIPLFMLMFAVYYSVSAYAGLLYRSSIMSVLAVVFVFFLCFSVGFMKVAYDDMVVDAARLVHVVDTGDTLIASNDALYATRHYTYDDENDEWKDIYIQKEYSFAPSGRPVYDAKGNQLLSMASVGFSQMKSLSVGRARDAWVRKQGALVPPDTVELLIEPDGGVLAVSREEGFFRLIGEALIEVDEGEADVEEDQPLGLDVWDVDPRLAANFQEEGVAQDEDAASEDANTAPVDEGGNEKNPAADAKKQPPTEEPPAEDPPNEPQAEPSPPEPSPPEPSDTERGSSDGNEIGEPDPAGDSEPDQTDTEDSGFRFGLGPEELAKVFPFEHVGPDKLPLPLQAPMAVAIDPSNSRITIYGNGQIAVYDRNEEGNYTETAKRDLPEGQEKAATLAGAGSVVIVALDNGQTFILNAATLDTVQVLTPEGEVPVRFAVSSENGEWVALLFHNRRLWLYNTRDKQIQKANIWAQGDISAVSFSGNNLLVIDNIARVREFELPSLKVTRTYSPRQPPYLSESVSMFGVQANYYPIHKWLITPLYAILPKPGELGWTINYLATGEQTDNAWWAQWAQMAQRGESTSDERHQLRSPWRGVRSCVLFVLFMLAISCWKINRTEF